jgi:hypothetical protein
MGDETSAVVESLSVDCGTAGDLKREGYKKKKTEKGVRIPT